MAIVVDEPIVNSPFAEPTRHYRMRGGRPELVEARRPSGSTPERPGVDHLVVEVKGLDPEQDRSKDVGAARWIAAVNHWGRMGAWRYAKVRTPYGLRQALG